MCNESGALCVACDGCSAFFHLRCMDLTEEDLAELSGWTCNDCKVWLPLIGTLARMSLRLLERYGLRSYSFCRISVTTTIRMGRTKMSWRSQKRNASERRNRRNCMQVEDRLCDFLLFFFSHSVDAQPRRKWPASLMGTTMTSIR